MARDVDLGRLQLPVVRDAADAFRDAYRPDGPCSVLVRPDGYLAHRQLGWDAAALTRVLGRTFA